MNIITKNRDLVEIIRSNVTNDWTVKESVKANLQRLVKRLLRKYGYLLEKQEKAMVTVLQQAELLCRDWATCVLMAIATFDALDECSDKIPATGIDSPQECCSSKPFNKS